MADNRPVLSKEQWQSVEVDYKSGNFKSVTELSQRYGLKVATLSAAIKRFGWKDDRDSCVQKVSQSIEKKALTEAQSYLNRAFKRVERYEKMIDVSQENLGSKNSEGIPLLDPEAINDYTIAETRIHQLAKSCLMIPDASKSIDITSKGQSLGESLISAIAKVRESQSEPKLTDSDLDKILEAEIVEE